jgi:hypothetical protein
MSTTIIFGNGLGMAMDPVFFSLQSAFTTAWNSLTEFDDKIKYHELIKLALPNISYPPTEEPQLKVLHQAVGACHFLSSLEGSNHRLITEEGLALPLAANIFLTKTALHFWNHQQSLPPIFSNCLAGRIRQERTHVVTLNYDNLLYQAMLSEKILNGYDGWLIDGFLKSGFNPSNLERRNSRLGWYLHLHGSPLFYEEENKNTGNSPVINKYRTMHLEDARVKRHLVLTAFDLKPDVISQSELLSAYWDFFQQALHESNKVMLFGYKGKDIHLNKELTQALADRSKKICVVEWEREGTDRKPFWIQMLKIEEQQLIHKPLNNILTYDWKD